MSSKQQIIDSIVQIHPHIYLGSASHALNNTTEFAEKKFEIVVNCAREIKHKENTTFIVRNFPVDKEKNVTILDYDDEICELLEMAVKNKKNLYIHSSDSNSRAPAFLIYWIMMRKKFFYYSATETEKEHYEFDDTGYRFSYHNALDLLEQLRPSIRLDENLESELIAMDSE
jgi:hypothetical protein